MRSFFAALLLAEAFLAPASAQMRPAPKNTIATRVQLPGGKLYDFSHNLKG